MNHEKTRKLTTLAVLVAMHIILSRFLSYSVWNMKIGFDFLPVAAAAVLYGPAGAAVVGAVGDFVGAILFLTFSIISRKHLLEIVLALHFTPPRT